MGPARGESHWKRASGGCKNAPEKVAIDLGFSARGTSIPLPSRAFGNGGCFLKTLSHTIHTEKCTDHKFDFHRVDTPM